VKRFGFVVTLAIGAAVLVGGAAGGDGPVARTDGRDQHPALAPFGVDVARLPAVLYLVRSRGALPKSAGVEVHGVRESVYLVSGDRDAVMALARKQCAVFPVDELPFPTRQPKPRVWKTITSPNPTIANMVAEVGWPLISARIDWLVGFGTRYSYAANHEDVAVGIAAVFDDIGLTPVSRSFVFNNTTMWNVEATQVGTVYPDSFVIMCAHFDSRSENPYVLAPGADDNGTGTAAVFVAAEILRDYDFQYSIRYICFDGEEQWLKGSQAYLRWAEENNLGIVGALNFDMIGYWEPGRTRDLEIATDTTSQWLAAAVANAADLYVGAPYQVHLDKNHMWSDHASFWAHGYSALNHEEAWDWSHTDFNPQYHTTHDSIAYIHPDFTVDNVKIGVASLATLARLDTTAVAVGDPVPAAPAARLSAHPNPSNGRVALTVSGVTDRDNVRVMIYDARGRRVGEVPVALQDGRGVGYWNAAGLERTEIKSGVYFGKIAGLPNATPAKLVYIK
jgi:hypothetical protein